VSIALDIALPVLEAGVTSARCLDWLCQVAMVAGAVRGTLELQERVEAARRTIPDLPGTKAGTPVALASMPA